MPKGKKQRNDPTGIW